MSIISREEIAKRLDIDVNKVQELLDLLKPHVMRYTVYLTIEQKEQIEKDNPGVHFVRPKVYPHKKRNASGGGS